MAVPGISDTDDEKMAAERIGEILKAQSYFQVYPENFGEIMIPGMRKASAGVWTGAGNKSSGRTVILPVIMMWSVGGLWSVETAGVFDGGAEGGV